MTPSVQWLCENVTTFELCMEICKDALVSLGGSGPALCVAVLVLFVHKYLKQIQYNQLETTIHKIILLFWLIEVEMMEETTNIWQSGT